MKEDKVCSCCKEFKSLTEFYKQGNRYESKCKECKKSSRKNKGSNFLQAERSVIFYERNKSNKNDDKAKNSFHHSSIFDREIMPEFDESILYPENERRSLGITDDDMDLVVSYFRWQFEQRNKFLNSTEAKI